MEVPMPSGIQVLIRHSSSDELHRRAVAPVNLLGKRVSNPLERSLGSTLPNSSSIHKKPDPRPHFGVLRHDAALARGRGAWVL